MKVAAFNVENLFDRAKAFNEDGASDVVSKNAQLNALFEKATYSSANKTRMLELMDDLGVLKSDKSKFIQIRKIRGRLIKRPQSGAPSIVASGRDDWVGWSELRTSAVNEIAIENTGRVIRDVDADVVALVEVESRPVLVEFNEQMLPKVSGTPYPHLMVIDGNDRRGIDVGLMTKDDYEIGTVRSHVHDLKPNGHPIFSRDCPEYQVIAPDGDSVWIIPNHFKSKFGGNNASSRAKRLAQSTATKKIYERLVSEGEQYVIVLGDLNDTPDSAELAPLLVDSDLRDASEHPNFTEFQFDVSNGNTGLGTYGLGNDNNKIDYLLVSPALFDFIETGGIFRKGAWPGSSPKRWDTYSELKRRIHVASDHHVIWVKFGF